MKKLKLPSLLSLAPQSKSRKPMNKLQAHASRLTQSAYDDYEEPTTKLSTAFVVVLVLHLVAVGGIYAFHSIKAKRREADGTAVTAKAVTAKAATPAPAATAATPAPAANVAVSSAAVSSAAVVNSPKTAAAVHAAGVPSPAPGAASNGAAAPKVASPHTRGENSASHLPPPVGPSAVIPAPKPPVQSPQSSTSVAAKAQPPSVVPVKAVAVVPAVVPAGGAAAESAHRTYTVQKGDNPVAIAKRMGVGYEEMLKLNGIEDPKKLQIGQVLKMPAKKQAN